MVGEKGKIIILGQDDKVSSRLSTNTIKLYFSIFAVTVLTAIILSTTPAFGANAKLPSGAGGVLRLNKPIVGISATPSGNGYWLVGSDGGIFTFGDADFYGSTGAKRLNQPILGMATTRSGKGYWLVAKDGGIFTFGNAKFYGSTGSIRLNKPIVGMAPTPSGKGYWLVASDGGIFAFGDARFKGSTGGKRLNQPIVGMAPTPSGKGYWLVASDGGIFTFGDARFYGSAGGTKLLKSIVGIAPTTSGKGYWLIAGDGGVFSYGDAKFYGSTGGGCLGSTTVAASSSTGLTGYYTVTANGQVRAFSPSATATCAGFSSNNSSSKENAIALDMFNRVNAERAARGLPAYKWNGNLASNARDWSVTMSKNNSFQHSNLYPLLATFNTAAENIGLGGQSTKSGAIHKAWMNSTGHRVNLLARNLDVIGIGVYCAPDGRLWATQQFGRWPNSSLPSGFGPTPSVDPIIKSDGGGPTC